MQEIEEMPVKQLPFKPTIKRQVSKQPKPEPVLSQVGQESVQRRVQITLEMYRNYRNQMRAEQIKERSQKMHNLFMNSL